MFDVTQVITSPMRRACETAEAVVRCGARVGRDVRHVSAGTGGTSPDSTQTRTNQAARTQCGHARVTYKIISQANYLRKEPLMARCAEVGGQGGVFSFIVAVWR